MPRSFRPFFDYPKKFGEDYGNEAPHFAVFSSPLLPRPCIYEIVILSRQERVWFSCINTGNSSEFESVPSVGSVLQCNTCQI